MSDSIIHLFPEEAEAAGHKSSMRCRCVPCVDLYEDPHTKQYQWIIRHSRMRQAKAA